jgi:hypothetical protein
MKHVEMVTGTLKPYVYPDGYARQDTPSALIKEYFEALSEINDIPSLACDWFVDDFESVRSRRICETRYYARSDAPYAWDPLGKLKSGTENHSIYFLLVSRMDYANRLRVVQNIPLYVKKAITEWLDTHIPLALHMEKSNTYDDDSLHAAVQNSVQSAYVHYMPGIDKHFHEGQLPDLVHLVPHSGFFGKEHDVPFQDDTSKVLLAFLVKGSIFKCKSRSINDILAEKVDKYPIVRHVFTRMLFCSLLGAYSHNRSYLTLRTRMELYNWFSVSGYPSKDAIKNFVANNKFIDKLVVQEYILFVVSQIPGLRAHLVKTGQHEALERATADCMDMVREKISENVGVMVTPPSLRKPIPLFTVDSIAGHYLEESLASMRIDVPVYRRTKHPPIPEKMKKNIRKICGKPPMPHPCLASLIAAVGVDKVLQCKDDVMTGMLAARVSGELHSKNRIIWESLCNIRRSLTVHVSYLNIVERKEVAPGWFNGTVDIIFPVDKAKLSHSYTPINTGFIEHATMCTRRIDAANHTYAQQMEVEYATDFGEKERELMRELVLRFDPGTNVSYEWLTPVFKVKFKCVELLIKAERLYVTESSVTDVFNVLTIFAKVRPYDYIVFKAFFAEMYAKEKVVFYDLPAKETLMQIESLHRIYGTKKGESLHPAAGCFYFCPNCYQFKAKLSDGRRNNNKVGKALGLLGGCLDTQTGIITCCRASSCNSKKRGSSHDAIKELNYFPENEIQASRKLARKERVISNITKCFTTKLQRVNMIGRLMVVSGIQKIMLCPFCASPAVVESAKFGKQGFSCGCLDAPLSSAEVHIKKKARKALPLEKVVSNKKVFMPGMKQCAYCLDHFSLRRGGEYVVYDDTDSGYVKKLFYCNRHRVRNWISSMGSILQRSIIHTAIADQWKISGKGDCRVFCLPRKSKIISATQEMMNFATPEHRTHMKKVRRLLNKYRRRRK